MRACFHVAPLKQGKTLTEYSSSYSTKKQSHALRFVSIKADLKQYREGNAENATRQLGREPCCETHPYEYLNLEAQPSIELPPLVSFAGRTIPFH